MNILIVGGTPAYRGGVEHFCERAQTALREIGGHRVEQLYSYSAYLRLRSLSGFWSCVRRLLHERKAGWQCVWLQYVNFPDLVILVLCRMMGYRILVTPHLGANWRSQRNSFLRWLGLQMLSTSNAIALLAATQREELALPVKTPQISIRTFLPRKLTLGARPQAGNGPLQLVHAARLSESKGSFLFLDLCAELQRCGHDFRGQLIGPCNDETRRRVDQFIDRENLGQSVEFVGPLPESELLKRLSTADVLVHLSSVDSFPLIVLESIGCGVFPICRNLPGARLITRTYSGHVVEGVDPVQEVFQFLVKNDISELRQNAAVAAGRLNQDYDWSTCVELLSSALAAVAE